MSKKRDPNQMLLDLARNKGPEVVHLPYTKEFEDFCRKINPAATTEDMHRIWEQLLNRTEVDTSKPDSSGSNEIANPPVTFVPEQVAVSENPPSLTPREPEKPGFLFKFTTQFLICSRGPYHVNRTFHLIKSNAGKRY